jgi:glutathione S-transferase
MLTLFYRPTCPFCQRVLGEVEDMGIKLNLRDISSDTVALDELVEKGGKKMVPFLVDDERGVSMYESGDIIAYLNEYYKKDTMSGENVCESCQ